MHMSTSSWELYMILKVAQKCMKLEGFCTFCGNRELIWIYIDPVSSLSALSVRSPVPKLSWFTDLCFAPPSNPCSTSSLVLCVDELCVTHITNYFAFEWLLIEVIQQNPDETILYSSIRSDFFFSTNSRNLTSVNIRSPFQFVFHCKVCVPHFRGCRCGQDGFLVS